MARQWTTTSMHNFTVERYRESTRHTEFWSQIMLTHTPNTLRTPACFDRDDIDGKLLANPTNRQRSRLRSLHRG